MAGDKEYVKLDVGNYLYTVHVNNLKKFTNSFLDRLVAPEHDKRESSCDFIKIQRDGRLFGHIINYLRDSDPSCLRGLSRKDLRDLQVDADFYGLDGLVQLCDDALSKSLSGNTETLEIIFGIEALERKLSTTDELTLVINIDKFIELSFIESMNHLVTLSNLNRIPVYGYKSHEADARSWSRLDLSNIILIVDQNLNIKHQLEVSRLTRHDEFLKKILKLIIFMTTLSAEDDTIEGDTLEDPNDAFNF